MNALLAAELDRLNVVVGRNGKIDERASLSAVDLRRVLARAIEQLDGTGVVRVS